MCEQHGDYLDIAYVWMDTGHFGEALRALFLACREGKESSAALLMIGKAANAAFETGQLPAGMCEVINESRVELGRKILHIHEQSEA